MAGIFTRSWPGVLQTGASSGARGPYCGGACHSHVIAEGAHALGCAAAVTEPAANSVKAAAETLKIKLFMILSME
jgi:hypothetical protein